MSFFRQFPKVDYDINRTGTVQRLVDIYRSIRPVENFVDDPSVYQLYQIKNGERPDIVSQRLYGTPEYYWTFFVVNEFLHDGYKVWPMSQDMLSNYLTEEYAGYVITTDPKIVRTGDGIINDAATSERSIIGKFTLGETLTGGNSGATGVLVKKNVDMNQLVVQGGNGNSYNGDGSLNNNNVEIVLGGTSNDSIRTYQVFTYQDAPHHYYKLDADGVEREFTNQTFITNPIGTINNIYESSFQAKNPSLENEIGIPTEETTEGEAGLTIKSNREYINELNDTRSKIRVINPDFITKFVEEFETLIN